MKDLPLWAVFAWAGSLCAFATVALVFDLKSRRIPNWLTVSSFVAAVAFHTALSGLSGLGFSLGGFAVGFTILLALWLIGGGGGGDVKLMGAVGAWTGAIGALFIFLGGVVAALSMTLGIVLWRALAPKQLAIAGARADVNLQPELAKTGKQKILIPFAVPVCLATWVVVGLKVLTLTHAR
ncbi:MAG: prepilin peptidase [Pirellulales bacterium]